jgi:hypothetical protein
MNIRNTIAAGIIGMYIAFAPAHVRAEEPQKQVHGMAEVMAGDKSGTIDTKLSVPIAPRVRFFARNRITSDYEGNVSDFSLAKIDVNVVDKLDVVAGAEAVPGVGVTPFVGLQYFKKFGDLSIYELLTVTTQEDTEGTSLTNICYNPKKGKWGFVTAAENVTKINGEGHKFSTQRIRAGASYGKIQFGAAGDLVEVGPKGKFGYNVGGFARRTF